MINKINKINKNETKEKLELLGKEIEKFEKENGRIKNEMTSILTPHPLVNINNCMFIYHYAFYAWYIGIAYQQEEEIVKITDYPILINELKDWEIEEGYEYCKTFNVIAKYKDKEMKLGRVIIVDSNIVILTTKKKKIHIIEGASPMDIVRRINDLIMGEMFDYKKFFFGFVGYDEEE